MFIVLAIYGHRFRLIVVPPSPVFVHGAFKQLRKVPGNDNSAPIADGSPSICSRYRPFFFREPLEPFHFARYEVRSELF